MTLSMTTKSQRFDVLISTHRAKMIRLAWRLLGPHQAAAEDVTQQAFMKAWAKFDTFRDEAALGTWLTKITVNQVRSYHRWAAVRHRSRRLLGLQTSTIPVTRDPGLSQRIQNAMGDLSTNQREAFTLV
jgi:RNA polymerase sigma-70 factor (ECF subfamily)